MFFTATELAALGRRGERKPFLTEERQTIVEAILSIEGKLLHEAKRGKTSLRIPLSSIASYTTSLRGYFESLGYRVQREDDALIVSW